MLPSQQFKTRVQFCFIEDETGLRNREFIGVDNMAWEADYPHSDSTWPYSPESAMKGFTAAAVPDAEIHKMTWQNAARWYDFEPFRHRSREECTVGALRAQAHDVDITPREYGNLQHARTLSVTAGKFLGGGQSMTLGQRDFRN
jgi:hypothetical protein